MNKTEERISELEHRSTKIIQTETLRRVEGEKNPRMNYSKNCETISKCLNTCNMLSLAGGQDKLSVLTNN